METVDNTMILVGCGNMGYALLSGWIAKGVAKKEQVFVIEPVDELAQRAAALGVTAVADIESLPQGITPHYIVFAIKPQLFDAVVPGYSRFIGSAVFASVLAGITVERFEKLLGKNAGIVRIMPNTPAAIGEGMMVYCHNNYVAAPRLAFIEALLGANGAVACVAENQMDAVTGLSGSGPAYVFYMIECLVKAGIAAGLDADTALLLARQTVKGAGLLASISNEMPAKLREQVTSPNGTTAAGLEVLMRDQRMENMITECVNAARERSIELGK